MKDLILSKSPVNTPLLDAELQMALGSIYLGMSTRLGEVIVFLEDDVSSQSLQDAQSIVLSHDPNSLSPEQEAELARQVALTTAREAHPSNLDLSQFSAATAEIQTLAEYLAWLELEIRDLRGL